MAKKSCGATIAMTAPITRNWREVERGIIRCDKHNSADNSNKNTHGYCYVANRSKNLSRVVEPLKKALTFPITKQDENHFSKVINIGEIGKWQII